MTTVHTLASGSAGNAVLISWAEGYLLVDAGISCKRILEELHSLDVQPRSEEHTSELQSQR